VSYDYSCVWLAPRVFLALPPDNCERRKRWLVSSIAAIFYRTSAADHTRYDAYGVGGCRRYRQAR